MMQDDQSPNRGRAGIVLAIDTSTEQAGLALRTERRVLSRSWAAGRTQTTSLMPAIDAMFRESGMAPNDLTAVAVATGPGTFTGLRVGMSIAKGMVLALGIPLVGIPTLEITAAAIEGNEDLVAVLPAGRGRVVWQRFAAGVDSAARNTTLDELVAALASMRGVLVTGELGEAQQERVASAHARVRWAHRDPAVLLRLAEARLARGEVDDPVTLEPVYLHGVVVQSGPVEDRLKRR